MSISSKIALAMSADGASFEEVHNSLEKLTDDFAIEFAEWIAINDYRCYSNGWGKLWEKGTVTPKELLEIYKKEK
jgi:hypothetical protein